MANLDNRAISESIADSAALVCVRSGYVLAISYCAYLIFCQLPVLRSVRVDKPVVDRVVDVTARGGEFEIPQSVVCFVPVFVVDLHTIGDSTTMRKPHGAVHEAPIALFARYGESKPVVRAGLVRRSDLFQTFYAPNSFRVWSSTEDHATGLDNQNALRDRGKNDINLCVPHGQHATITVEV